MIVNVKHLAYSRCLLDVDWTNGILKVWREWEKAASRKSDSGSGMDEDEAIGRQAGQILESQKDECE